MKYNLNFSFLICCFLFSNLIFGQSFKIKWTDNEGREFSLMAPTGEFSFIALPGDNLKYAQYGEFAGQIIQIGNVYIDYERYGDSKGKINKIGNVLVIYGKYGILKGKLIKVGGLSIEYEEYGISAGKVKATKGQVLF